MPSDITSSDFENQTPGQALCEAFQEKLLNNSKMQKLLDYFFTDPDGKLNKGFIGDLLAFVTPIGTVIWVPKTLDASVASPTDGAQWLEANNQRLSQTDYARLYAVYGLAYKVDGDNDATDFRVPDLQGKFLLGRSGGHAYGTTGGEETHVLTTEELTPHQHAIASTEQVANIAGGGSGVTDLDASSYLAGASNKGGSGSNSYVLANTTTTKATVGLTSVTGGAVSADDDAISFPVYTDKFKAAGHNTMPPYFTGVYYVLAGYKVAGVMV